MKLSPKDFDHFIEEIILLGAGVTVLVRVRNFIMPWKALGTKLDSVVSGLKILETRVNDMERTGDSRLLHVEEMMKTMLTMLGHKKDE